MINIFDYIDSIIDDPKTKYYALTVVLFPLLELLDHEPKKRRKEMSFEKKVGDVFNWKDKTLVVKKVEGSNNCSNCFFYNYDDCYNLIFATGPCTGRKDKNSVVFELKKEDNDGK